MAIVLLAHGARGELVSQLQGALRIVVDGVFGQGTEAAVRKAQQLRHLPLTGAVDATTWEAIVGTPHPSLFERCLGLTACFEGHGYGLASGNWDGAGLTWGIIGFNLKSGSLRLVLDRVSLPVLVSALTAEGAEQLNRAMHLLNAKDRVAWGDSISNPGKKALVPVWQARFAALGASPEVQAAQRYVAEHVYWHPAIDFLGHNLPWLTSERAAALAFDCWVQQGRILPEAVVAAQERGEVLGMVALAEAQAVGSYATDIRERRLCIAKGVGVVHKRTYTLACYGITLDAR